MAAQFEVFTDAVKAQQSARGSRDGYARFEAKRGWRREITPDLAAFVAARQSIYLGTASADGQPYIQHRGGPKGFLKVLGPLSLGFADFGGNRQYITLGHLSENPKATIFLMDYANRQRIKLWGRAEVREGDAELMDRLTLPGYEAKPERAILFDIEAWDINCPQHIPRLYDEETMAAVIGKLQGRVAELEAELARRPESS